MRKDYDVAKFREPVYALKSGNTYTYKTPPLDDDGTIFAVTRDNDKNTVTETYTRETGGGDSNDDAH